jgi:hypothetical protein
MDAINSSVTPSPLKRQNDASPDAGKRIGAIVTVDRNLRTQMRWRRHGRREIEDVVKDLQLDQDSTKRKLPPEMYWCRRKEVEDGVKDLN